MPLIIPNTTVQDDYTDALTFAGQDVFQGGYFTVANNPVACQLGIGIHGQAAFSYEQYLPPATYPIVPGGRIPVSGLRFKNFVPGSPAQVFGGLTYPGEPSIQAGTPYSSFVSASGSVVPGGTGAMIQIATQLLTAPAANISFTAIPNIYIGLQIHLTGRVTAAVVGSESRMRFNGDAGNNYSYEIIAATAGAIAVAEADVNTYARCGVCPGTTAPANVFALNIIDIHEYVSTTKFRPYYWREASRDSAAIQRTESGGGVYFGALAAIAQIDLFDGSGGNWDTGTRATLYGIGAL